MIPFSGASALAAVGLGWWKWIQRNAGPSMSLPGAPKQLDTRLLEIGSGVLQDKAPIGALRAHLDGLHHWQSDVSRQMETHRYCAQINEDFVQCVMFDGNTEDARLVGVEYIITERLFARLPPEERELWHSHLHEVAAGLVAAPGLPASAERAWMEKLAGTYGKTWCTWDTERDDLPLGTPRLLSSFAPGEAIRCSLREARDHRLSL